MSLSSLPEEHLLMGVAQSDIRGGKTLLDFLFYCIYVWLFNLEYPLEKSTFIILINATFKI